MMACADAIACVSREGLSTVLSLDMKFQKINLFFKITVLILDHFHMKYREGTVSWSCMLAVFKSELILSHG